MALFEFTIEGPPLSHQTRDKKKLRAWKSKVQRAARAFWHGPPLAIPLKIAVAYYHEGMAVSIDNDNLLKPIQDALSNLIYADDRWITDTIVRKTSIDSPINARRVSLVLLTAFSAGKQFVHVQLDRAPEHETTI